MTQLYPAAANTGSVDSSRPSSTSSAWNDDFRPSALILQRLLNQIDFRAVSREASASSAAGANLPPSPGHDLGSLAAEIDAALSAHRQVGQLNPRRPGLHNNAIQFAKRVLRRSLSWYTRPIQLFQVSVIRVLQQTRSFQVQNDALRSTVHRISAEEMSLQQTRHEFQQTAQNLDRSRQSLAQELTAQTDLLGKLRAEFDSFRREFQAAVTKNRSQDQER